MNRLKETEPAIFLYLSCSVAFRVPFSSIKGRFHIYFGRAINGERLTFYSMYDQCTAKPAIWFRVKSVLIGVTRTQNASRFTLSGSRFTIHAERFTA